MFKRVHPYVLIILAIVIHFIYMKEYYEVDLANTLVLFLCFVLFAATFIYAIYKVVKDKRPISFMKRTGPLWLSIILVFSFPVTSWLVDTDGGKKTTISARYFADLNFISLDLRTDHTFKLFNGGPFGGKYYRGQYELEKDTLRIYNDSLRHLYPTLTFSIKTDSLRHRYFEPLVPNKADSLNQSYYLLEIASSSR